MVNHVAMLSFSVINLQMRTKNMGYYLVYTSTGEGQIENRGGKADEGDGLESSRTCLVGATTRITKWISWLVLPRFAGRFSRAMATWRFWIVGSAHLQVKWRVYSERHSNKCTYAFVVDVQDCDPLLVVVHATVERAIRSLHELAQVVRAVVRWDVCWKKKNTGKLACSVLIGLREAGCSDRGVIVGCA